MEDKLVVRASSLTSTTEFSVKYNEMADNPARLRGISFGWLFVTGILFVISVVLGISGLRAVHGDDRAALLIPSLIFTALTILIGLNAWKLTFDSVIYACRGGQVSFRYNKPDVETFRQFLQALQEKISNHSNIEKVVARRLLSWLSQEGFLDEWKLKEVKTRLQIPDEAN